MLQATDLKPPQPCVDARLRHWGLFSCPTERDVPSKTLAFDETVMLDSGRPLDRSSAPAAAEPVYLAFRAGCPQRNVSLHRGTSQRRLSWSGTLLTAPRRSAARRPDGHRNLAQIKARGRWRADCSVQR